MLGVAVELQLCIVAQAWERKGPGVLVNVAEYETEVCPGDKGQWHPGL